MTSGVGDGEGDGDGMGDGVGNGEGDGIGDGVGKGEGVAVGPDEVAVGAGSAVSAGVDGATDEVDDGSSVWLLFRPGNKPNATSAVTMTTAAMIRIRK